MIRQRTTPLFLILALAAAGLQTACAESGSDQNDAQAASKEQSTTDDSAAQATSTDGAAKDGKAGGTQMAANGSGGAGGGEAADSGADSSGKPYTVKCGENVCRASEDVIAGYERYHATCHTCHGPNAVGSTFAPSLVDRLEDKSLGYFAGVVANGRQRFDSTTGTYSVMPAWKDNPAVMQSIPELWAYLKARADGALPPVHPKPLK